MRVVHCCHTHIASAALLPLLAPPRLPATNLLVVRHNDLEERDTFRVKYRPAHLEHLVDYFIRVELVGDVLDHADEHLHAVLGGEEGGM